MKTNITIALDAALLREVWELMNLVSCGANRYGADCGRSKIRDSPLDVLVAVDLKYDHPDPQFAL